MLGQLCIYASSFRYQYHAYFKFEVMYNFINQERYYKAIQKCPYFHLQTKTFGNYIKFIQEMFCNKHLRSQLLGGLENSCKNWQKAQIIGVMLLHLFGVTWKNIDIFGCPLNIIVKTYCMQYTAFILFYWCHFIYKWCQ